MSNPPDGELKVLDEAFRIPDAVLMVLTVRFGVPDRGCHEVAPRNGERRFRFQGRVAGFLTYNGGGWHAAVQPEEFTASDVPNLSAIVRQANEDLAALVR